MAKNLFRGYLLINNSKLKYIGPIKLVRKKIIYGKSKSDYPSRDNFKVTFLSQAKLRTLLRLRHEMFLYKKPNMDVLERM